jgi:hypothetical protein
MLKPNSEYSLKTREIDGYDKKCKACYRSVRLYGKLYEKDQINKINEYSIEFKKTNENFIEISKSINGFFRIYKYIGEINDLYENIVYFMTNIKENQSFIIDFELGINYRTSGDENNYKEFLLNVRDKNGKRILEPQGFQFFSKKTFNNEEKNDMFEQYKKIINDLVDKSYYDNNLPSSPTMLGLLDFYIHIHPNIITNIISNEPRQYGNKELKIYKGSKFVVLPKIIEYTNSIVNVRNKDKKCFLW